jgi:prophage antirepressor-like protein
MQLNTFTFSNKEIRMTFDDQGNPLWVAKDVAEALGYTWHHNLISHIPEEWKGGNPITTPGGIQQMITLSLEGLNFFLFRSDKAGALPLQKKIASEILPSIQKTGLYSVKTMSPAEMLLAQAQAMVDQERKLNALESKIEKMETRHECVEKELDKLPEPTIEAPERSKFDQVKMIIADYCDRTGNKDDFRRCYQTLYHHLYTRFHISLAACTKIHKKESMLQIAERLGYGEQLYSLAHELFAPASRILHESEAPNDERILY